MCLFLLQSNCVSHNRPIELEKIIEIVETRYDARCDSLLLLSTDDFNHPYFAVNLVEDSSNLSWWVFGSLSIDSITFYSFFDFVNVVIEQCNNIDRSISIINQAMIDKDYQWQCTPIDSISFCSYYSKSPL